MSDDELKQLLEQPKGATYDEIPTALQPAFLFLLRTNPNGLMVQTTTEPVLDKFWRPLASNEAMKFLLAWYRFKLKS